MSPRREQTPAPHIEEVASNSAGEQTKGNSSMNMHATITRPDQTANAAAALWRIAVSEYEAADAAYQAISAKHDEQNAAYNAEIGERPTDFEHYMGAHPLLSEQEKRGLTFALAMAITVKDYPGRDITAEAYRAIMEKAGNIIAARDAHSRHSNELYDRTIGTVEKAWEDALSALHVKREVLLLTQAPDEAALLYKLTELAAIMTESDAEDAEEVRAIRDDAKRLIGRN